MLVLMVYLVKLINLISLGFNKINASKKLKWAIVCIRMLRASLNVICNWTYGRILWRGNRRIVWQNGRI